MTNKEKYKQAFSAVHPSDDLVLEVIKMKESKRYSVIRPMAAVLAAVILLMGCATVAYAADVGGIQRLVQIWFAGDLTQATIVFDGTGGYDMEFTDSDGNMHNQSGGGVAFEDDGTERPLTEEELMEHLTRPDVRYLEDGSVWVYWYDQKIEITDKFANGICYVKLVKGKETIYMTVKYQNGWATSTTKYVIPDEFNF